MSANEVHVSFPVNSKHKSLPLFSHFDTLKEEMLGLHQQQFNLTTIWKTFGKLANQNTGSSGGPH